MNDTDSSDANEKDDDDDDDDTTEKVREELKNNPFDRNSFLKNI